MNNFWEEKNVLITGCTGFIGSWLTKELIEKGAKVTGIIRDSVPTCNFNLLNLSKKVNIVPGEIEDFNTIKRSLAEYNIDTVFHLAAQPIVTIALKDPMGTFRTNIMGTWNILEACRQLDVKRVIIASSDKAYGTHDKLPYDETFELLGRYPYDVTKSCSDMLAQTYFKTYGLPIGITRCGNVYGGGDLNFNRIVPETMKNIIQNKNPVIRSDGKFIREYFYVKDTAGAYLRLAENMHKPEVKGEAFNFGSEEPITVLDFVQRMIDISGKKNLKPEVLNQAKAEITTQYLSSKKASKILEWTPKYSLNDGLKETYEWYQNYLK